MSDVGEKWRYLIANSGMTPEAAMRFIAECIELGVAASAYRDDIGRAKKRTGGLHVVAQDQGGKTGD
jgi:hypothetical protein